jgi:hypothetical protein
MLGLLLHVDNGKDVEMGNPQVIKCIFCYINLVNKFNPSIQHRKRLITYYKTYGVIRLKKHVDVDHVIIIAKAIEEEVNSLIRGLVKKTTNKLKAQFVRHYNL